MSLVLLKSLQTQEEKDNRNQDTGSTPWCPCRMGLNTDQLILNQKKGFVYLYIKTRIQDWSWIGLSLYLCSVIGWLGAEFNLYHQ